MLNQILALIGRTFPNRRAIFVASLVALSFLPTGNVAQTVGLRVEDLRSVLPGLGMAPSKNVTGGITLSTARTPDLTLSPTGFQLVMYWNSIDDQNWPLTRILDSLAGKACGKIRSGLSDALLERLYASRSLAPEQDLGGNAGSTFKKMLSEQLGGCRIEMVAQGARWHTLIANVSYGSAVMSNSPGVFQYTWRDSIPANAVTAADVQHALIWTGHYEGMVDGNIGPYSRRAITAWQTSKGYETTGLLTLQQTLELINEGLRQRDAYGWALLTDDAIGFSVGIPTKLSQIGTPRWDQDSWWYEATGTFRQSIGIMRIASTCSGLDAYYNALLKPTPEREIRYKARKDDWFVVAGQAGDRYFYSRAECRGDGLVTVVANVATTEISSLGFLFTALSNSLVLRPVLNLSAQPAPRLVYPSAAPGHAPTDAQPRNLSTSSSAVPSGPEIDRAGKTNAIRLALAEGSELNAREVFERVAGAVFVVQTSDTQGSAVAVSDRTLLTNCHVVGSSRIVRLERDGQKLFATVTSANSGTDRCVLTSDATLQKWVRVRPFADVKIGERAFSIGTPQGFELTIAEGIVSSKRVKDGDRVFQTSAPISKGSSGGGLFDAQGNLLGITTWIRKDAQNLNFAIAAEEYAK